MKSKFYLIGGAPRCGKTTIAKKLSEKISVPWISTDTIESVVAEYVTETDKKRLFPKKVMRELTNNSNDEMYGKYDTDEIVRSYFEQAKGLEKGIEMFLESENKNNNPVILEGYHITPALVKKLGEQGYDLNCIFLGREDNTNTVQFISKASAKNDWVIEKTQKDETFMKIAEMITMFSRELSREAPKDRYMSVDRDFEKRLEEGVLFLSQ